MMKVCLDQVSLDFCLTGCKTEVILSSLNTFNSNSTCRDYLEDKTLATNLVNH